MKNFYLIHSLTGAGTTRQADLVCRELHALGVEITLLVGSRVGVNVDQFSGVDYPVLYLAEKKLGYIAFVMRLAIFLRKHPKSTLLSGAKKVNIKAIDAHKIARHRAPLILTLTNNIAQFSTQSGKQKNRSLGNHYKKYQYADKIIVISQAMHLELEDNGFAKDKLAFCPPPIDVRAISEQSQEKIEHPWLNEHKSDRAIPVILSAGRFDPQKNFPMLIKAFAIARQERDLRLIILGEGNAVKQAEFSALAVDLGVGENIEFAGFQPNPFAYMAQANLFALCSDWEGFGLVLAEALVCGTPVLATDCPHGPSEILEGTQNTALTPIGNAEAFAAEMLRLLSSQNSSSQHNIKAMARYNSPEIAQRYKDILDNFH